MRLALLAICTLGVSQTLVAQVAPQPGQLASVVLPSLDAQPMVSVSQRPLATERAARRDRNMNRVWMLSMAAMLAGTSADAATSWGKMEGNGLLASPNGQFGVRAVGIKGALAAALLVPQLVLRHNKTMRTRFTIANFVEAGVFTGVSIHNLGVTAPTH